MSLTYLLLGVYSSIGMTENKPLFYYNSLFYTATGCSFGKFKKNKSGQENTSRRIMNK